MVDAAIVMIENAHKRLERAPPGKPRREVLIEAAVEVGPALFFSLLIITVSFLPIFALEAQEGRLFKPLAYTKTFAMAAAALLSVLLVPALMTLFVRGRIMPEHKNPVNRFLIWIYRPVIQLALRFKAATILIALVVLGVSLWPASKLGSEFMPNLNEGTLFYMPVTLPGISVTKAAELLQTQNKIIKSFPEVESVWGKAGRASTATDPAPTEMVETVINLKPESEWRPGMTVDKLIAEMDQIAAVPRRVQCLDHADQGAHRHALDRHPHAGRRQGVRQGPGRDRQARAPDRGGDPQSAGHLERLCRARHRRLLPECRSGPRAARALRADGRRRAGRDRHGARRRAGDDDGRGPRALYRQHPLSPRLPQRPEAIASQVLIPMPDGGTVPLGEVAKVSLAQGPSSIRTENAQLALYIYVDLRDRDLGSYVADAQKAVAAEVDFPPGYYATWSGQFEYLRARQGAAARSSCP